MRRVKDPDAPNRCRATAADRGQCWNESCDGSDYCRAHGGAGNKALEQMNTYLAEQFARRIKVEGGEIDEIKVLKENLMVLNGTIAARTKLMTDESSMLAHSGPVTDLIMKAEKVTASLHRLATASGFLLAKPALITWGQEIVQAVAAMVEDKYDGWEDDLVDLSHAVASIIIQADNKEPEKD